MARLLILLGVIAASGRASASDERLALASGDAELERALAAALGPAGIAIVAVGEHPPLGSGDTLAASREITSREAAAAAVWITPAADGASMLSVFDRSVDRVMARSLAYAPPFSPEQAAAAARMVRTMLRALRVTPDIDEAPPPAEEAARVRAAGMRPEGGEEETARADLPDSTPPPEEVVVEAPRPQTGFAFETGGGVRVGGAVEDLDWQFALSLLWYAPRVAFGLSGSLGAEATIAGPELRVRFRDDTVALVARLPVWLGEHIGIEPLGGVALHVTVLEGTVAGGSQVRRVRLDPGLRIGSVVRYRVTRSLQVGVWAAADWLVRRQSYLVGSQTVLALPPLQATAGVLLHWAAD